MQRELSRGSNNRDKIGQLDAQLLCRYQLSSIISFLVEDSDVESREYAI